MKAAVVLLVALGLGAIPSMARGQMSVEEAMKRLKDRQAHERPDTRPVSRVAAKRPVAAPARPAFDPERFSPGVRLLLETGETQRVRWIDRVKSRVEDTKLTIRHLGDRHRYGDQGTMRKYLASLFDVLHKESDPRMRYTVLPVLGQDLRVGAAGYPGAMSIFQRSGKDALMHCQGNLVWVTGLDLSGMVDGQVIDSAGVMRVTGTRQYATALGGSKTVYVLSPMQLPGEIVRRCRPLLEIPEAPVSDPGRPPAPREYHRAIAVHG